MVEGPAAVLYGRGSSGSLVNRITKKPTMEGTEGYVGVTGGSYGERRVEADASDSWRNNTLGGRLTGAGEYTGSQRHYYYMNRMRLRRRCAGGPTTAPTCTRRWSGCATSGCRTAAWRQWMVRRA